MRAIRPPVLSPGQGFITRHPLEEIHDSIIKSVLNTLEDRGVTLEPSIFNRTYYVLESKFKDKSGKIYRTPLKPEDPSSREPSNAPAPSRRYAATSSRPMAGAAASSSKSAAVPVATKETTTKMYKAPPKEVYEFPGRIPKTGPPLNVNDSFYWSHDDPTFAGIMPYIDMSAYEKPKSTQKADLKDDAGTPVISQPHEKLGTPVISQPHEKLETPVISQPHVELGRTPVISQPHSSEASKTISSISGAECGIQEPSTQESTSQESPNSLDSWVSQPSSSWSTTATVGSTQCSEPNFISSGNRPTGSTTRAMKVPVSAANLRRSLRRSHGLSEPLVPETATLGKRTREPEASEATASHKKPMTKADMVKHYLPRNE